MPWLGNILVAGGAALGRLVAVHLLPTTVLAVVVWVTVHARAFDDATKGLHWSDLFTNFQVDTGNMLLFIVALFALAALLQPFDIAAVRLLEGYWKGNRIGDTASRLFTHRHRRRVRKATRMLEANDLAWEKEEELRRSTKDDREGGDPNMSVEKQTKTDRREKRIKRCADRAGKVRPMYPPNEDEIMPTMLGNVLRAAERRAGERYYLPTIETLPRVYAHLSKRLSVIFDASVDTMDAAAMMTISTAAAALVGAAAFYDDPGLRWVPVVLAVTSVLSYRGAVVAAAQYGTYLDIAYDFHRFDLIKALHLDLPINTEQEKELCDKLWEFWKTTDALEAQAVWDYQEYRHYEEHACPCGSSHTTDDEHPH
jgi:hypothetical protein